MRKRLKAFREWFVAFLKEYVPWTGTGSVSGQYMGQAISHGPRGRRRDRRFVDNLVPREPTVRLEGRALRCVSHDDLHSYFDFFLFAYVAEQRVPKSR